MAGKLDYLRALVYSRCVGYCEKCGRQLGDNWALHHRQLKSRGGKDEISNFVALHHACHNLGTDSVHLNPEKATDRGLMVPSWQDSPSCPLTLSDGSIVMLTEEGTYKHLGKVENGW